ncbi:hypothetical protein OF83DRAFT_1170358 [Amylostereum chailletii]|nr:hypothetical protein OF83DRAFT_1170358 [Amylostereum chailletii]
MALPLDFSPNMPSASVSATPATPAVDDLSYPLACDDRTRDAVQTIVAGRKSWKTLKGKGEAVWPPYLEAALVEALDRYRPETSRSTRSLSRFPNRNRFISDYIFHVTGKRRTAKQVGSRLQQLRDTCGGKRILKLLSNRDFSSSDAHSSSSSSSSAAAFSTTNPLSPSLHPSPSPNSIKPTRALVHIDVLPASAPWPPLSDPTYLRPSTGGGAMLTPPLSPSSPVSSLAPSSFPLASSLTPTSSSPNLLANTFHSSVPRPLRAVDPTVTFTSAANVRAHSVCAVYFNGNCVHREITPLSCSAASHFEGAGMSGYVYRAVLIPGFWTKLCESNDPGRYSIVQEIVQQSSSHPSSPSSSSSSLSLGLDSFATSSVLLTVVYQLNEPATSSASSSSPSTSYTHSGPSPSPAPSLETDDYGFPLSMISSQCDSSSAFGMPDLPISPVSATFGESATAPPSGGPYTLSSASYPSSAAASHLSHGMGQAHGQQQQQQQAQYLPTSHDFAALGWGYHGL